eukprot:scaffold29208_cov118-Phaeocystis_antarctica.AAC.5
MAPDQEVEEAKRERRMRHAHVEVNSPHAQHSIVIEKRNEIHAHVANYVALVARLAHGECGLAQRGKGHRCLRESSANKGVC